MGAITLTPQEQNRLLVLNALQLRMAGIGEKEAANAFLPGFIVRYNARFAKPAAHPEPVDRPWPAGVDPDTIFCFKYLRTVANDHTVTLGPDLVQIVPNGRSYAKVRVEIHEHVDGTMAVFYQGHPPLDQAPDDADGCTGGGATRTAGQPLPASRARDNTTATGTFGPATQTRSAELEAGDRSFLEAI